MASSPPHRLATDGFVAAPPPGTTTSSASADTPKKPMLPLLLFDDGDTLAYIDPAPESNKNRHVAVPTTPLRIHSEKLLATGSAYFERLFRPRYQTRVRKQRGFAAGLPDGVKYVIDLTPATLDDEAIILLTEVTCPLAIRTWAMYRHIWSLPKSCVCGEDDMEEGPVEEVPPPMIEPLVVDDQTESFKEEDAPDRDMLDDTEEDIVEERRPLPKEYSGARHREGIEHVLHVLEGLNITLDTPCKLWTFFAVAKLFDVAAVTTVSNYIISWFYESANTRFIEIHPDIAYRVACGTKASGLCRHAFIGLVADEALLYIIRSTNAVPIAEWQGNLTQSRICDTLDDIELQRIEYASKSFADTVINHFLHLVGYGMTWMDRLGEFKKLIQHLGFFPEDRDTVLELIGTLKDFVRYKIYDTLKMARDPLRPSDAVPSGEKLPYRRIFQDGHLLHRLLGKAFWGDLLRLNMNFCGATTNDSKSDHDSISEVGSGLLAFHGHENAKIWHTSRHFVDAKAQFYNDVLHRRSTVPADPESMTAKLATEGRLMNLTINLRQPENSFHETGPSTSVSPSGNIHYPNSDRTTGSTARPSDTTAFTQLDDVVKRTINLDVLFSQVCSYISTYSRRLMYPSQPGSIQRDATDTLTCLTDNEYRFLPLWAGGNDDGTGGVFTDQEIPAMETGGFSTPGPAVHTGSVASSDCSFSDINPSDSMSTVQRASHHATFSHASDLMSVDSFDEIWEADAETRGQCAAGTAMDGLGESLSSAHIEDFDLDSQSDSINTVTMGSPVLSDIDFGIQDGDEEDTKSDLDVDGFNLVEKHS